MKPEVASRRIESFSQRFGEAHLYLAYHAAFPLALTPDLLYRLWSNFQHDIHGEFLNIPWLAVADLLLSSLCDEVGYELYEMDKAVRNLLLRELQNNSCFGEQRISELSDFLLTYVREQLESHDPDVRDFTQAQKWTALAYTKPSEAARELALALKKLNLEEKVEWVRMASLVETFAEPLAAFKPLLIYARGMANFVRNNLKDAEAQFNQLHLVKPEVKIAGISLDIPLEPTVFVKENISDYQNVKPKSGKIALLIGISEYEPGLTPLPNAVNDVEAMRRVLVNPEMGDFAPENVTVLKNPQRQEMEDAIYNLYAHRYKDDLLLFYFSGHGVTVESSDFYFSTSITRKNQNQLVPTTAVAGTSVHSWMNQSKSKRQVVILDCCFSGAFAKGLTAKNVGTIDLQRHLGGEGRVILTSSTSTQYAFESDGLDLSIYTHYLVKGIETGSADIDGDGWISVDELHSYVKSKVQEAAPAMTPEFYAFKEGYRIFLAKSPKDDPKLKYRKEVEKLALENEGEISDINRFYSDELRDNLGLSVYEAGAIELEVLEPYRKRREKLQRYEQALSSVKKYPLTEKDRNDLERLQNILNLRDEDVASIEAQILGSTNYINTFAPNEE
ncbi:hypothetical protein BCD64_06110 [Nostoc sp. MBR 210]|nr:hypothetical protein BCD64_06110 [Nostoc sp. MBR 210]